MKNEERRTENAALISLSVLRSAFFILHIFPLSRSCQVSIPVNHARQERSRHRPDDVDEGFIPEAASRLRKLPDKATEPPGRVDRSAGQRKAEEGRHRQGQARPQ